MSASLQSPETPPLPSTEALPDPVLGAILALAGTSEGPSVTLVCQRWRRVFYSEPGIWRRFQLGPGRASSSAAATLAAKHALLCRMNGMAQRLTAWDGGNRWRLSGGCSEGSSIDKHPALADCLILLQPALLTQLSIDAIGQPLPGSALQQLQGFTALQELAVKATSLPRQTPALLPQLPRLRSLACTCNELPGGMINSMAQHLQQLEVLRLAVYHAPLPSGLQQLTALEALTRLSLLSWREDVEPVQPPCPPSFRSLQAFRFFGRSGVEVAGARFLSCNLDSSADNECTLVLQHVAALPSLWQLLDALLPRHVSLGSLGIEACPALEPAAVAGCESRLAALTRLHTGECRSQQFEAALALMLAQAPRLERLEVSRCLEGALPACVVESAGLCSLMLVTNNVTTLPAGLYLASLESICCAEPLASLPPALAAATALRELDLRGCSQLAVSAWDVWLLAGLPRLQTVKLREGQAAARMARVLWRTMQGLRTVTG